MRWRSASSLIQAAKRWNTKDEVSWTGSNTNNIHNNELANRDKYEEVMTLDRVAVVSAMLTRQINSTRLTDGILNHPNYHVNSICSLTMPWTGYAKHS